MSENDQKIERESEFGAKHVCLNNRMVFKFTRNCMVMDKTNRPDKI